MKRLACSLLSILILLTISCEIGLGESVDTDPPSLNIDTDIVDKIIRDDFVLRGTYSDDGKIDGISVVLKRTDKTGSSSTFYGTIHEEGKNRGSGTWTIDIPAKTKGIQDGAYQADVTIIDSTKRTTVQSTVFTIDNTPPLIILTRPSTSLASSSFDTYGRKFTIEGAAAEANNIGRLEIQLYTDQACTIKAADEPIVLTNVPISIEVEAANYDTDASKYIYEGITQKFELDVPTNGDGKEFYYKLFAYDGAIRYLEKNATQTDDDKKGNRAEYFFLQKDIYEDIGQYYTTTELYSIMSGTYTGDDSSRSAGAPDSNTVKNDLLDAVKYQRTVGKFSLNPKNNPTYTITGRSPLASVTKEAFDNSDNELLNGGQLIIEVSPGLDGHLLKEDTIKLYTRRYTFNGTTPVKSAPVELTKYEKKTSGSSYKFITTIDREDGFEVGSYYEVYVEGKDVKGTDIVSAGSKPYGFKLVSNGRPPVLTITEPEEATIFTNEQQIFKGKVEVELGTPVVYIYRGKGDDAELVKTIEFTSTQGVKEGSDYVYEFTYADLGFDGTTKTQRFVFLAEAEGVKSAQPECTVVYDMNVPTISITKPSTAKKFSDNIGSEVSGAYINGSVEFTVMLNDKGGSGLDTETNKPKWEIFDATNKTTAIASGIIEETSGETIEIDTTDSKYDGKTITFRVTAYDAAGNKKTTEADDDKYTFIVDQDTDNPYICEDTDYGKINFNLNSVDSYMNQSAAVKSGTVKKGSTLKFKVYEDDGTAKISILKKKLTITKNNGTYTSDWTNDLTAFDDDVFVEEIDSPKNLVAMNSYSFPATDAECGYYEYAIIATDKSDNSANPRKIVKGPFIVRITKDEASVSVEKDFDYRNENSEFTNTVTIIPSDGPYKLYRQVVIAGGTYNDKTFSDGTDVEAYKIIYDNIPDTDLTHEDKIKISDYTSRKDITVYYKVIDGSSQASAPQSVVLKYDNDAFTPEIRAPLTGKTGKQALTETTQISARLRDDKAGVEKVFYKFTDDANPGTQKGIDGGYTEDDASNGSFTLDPEFVEGLSAGANELCEGKWFFHIYTEDGAGNISDVATREFDIDMKSPVITTTLDDTTISTDAIHNKNSAYTFKFKIKETNALNETEPVTITIKKGSEPLASTAFKIKDGNTEKSLNQLKTNKEYTIEIPDQGDGLYTYTIKVKDFVGKEASVERKVQFDTTPPVATHEIDSSLKDLYFRIGDYANAAGDEDVGGKYQNGTYGNALTIQIRGYFADAESGSGIKKFYYKTFNNQEVVVDGSKDYSGATDDKPYLEGTGNEAGKIFFKNADILKNFVMSKNTGTFYPLESVEEKTVEYNIGPFGTDAAPVTSVPVSSVTDRYGGTPTTPIADGKYTVNENHYVQFKKTVPSNYKATISGFEEGKNFLVLVAEDNVGNTTIDYAEVTGVGTFYCYSLNVDITSPSIPTKEDETRFTNIDSTNADSTVHFYIEGTVSDKPNKPNGSSGIKSIVFTRDGGTGEIKLTADKLLDLTEGERAAVPEEFRDDATLKHWKVDVKSLLPSSGTAIISAKVTDNAGFDISVPVASITVDKKEPVVSITSPAKNDTFAGAKNLKISGSATDGNGAGLSNDDLKVYYTKSATLGTATMAPDPEADFGTNIANKWVEVGSVTSDASWSFTKALIDTTIAPEDVNTPVYFMVSAKDNSGTGNVGYSEPRKITIDRKKPTLDSLKLKNTDSGSISTSWFNDETLLLSGAFNDDGSGVSEIGYTLTPHGSSTSLEGTIAPTLKDGKYEFAANISGFKEGKNNTLKVWAKDKADNKLELTTYTVQLDETQPTVKSDSEYANTQYVNLVENSDEFVFVITGKANDINTTAKPGSGVDSVVIEINNHKISTADSTYGTLTLNQSTSATIYDSKWTAKIKKNAFGTEDGNIQIYATVTDKAGMSQKSSVATINIDTTAPIVNITSPADADRTESGTQVNGTIEISGSSRDPGGELDTILAVVYSTTTSAKPVDEHINSAWEAPSGWAIIPGMAQDTESNVNAWKFTNIDTTQFNKGDIYITACVRDKAGNIGYATPITLKVDQDSDRPVITLSNLRFADDDTTTTYLKSTKDLYFTVTDDDGDVESIQYKYKIKNGDTETWTWSDYADYEEGIKGLNDGENTIYFKIKDANGITFETDTAKQPVIKGNRETKVNNKDVVRTIKDGTVELDFNVVTENPVIDEVVKYCWYNNKTDKWTEFGDTARTFGGIYTKIQIKVKVTSAQGVKSVESTYSADAESTTAKQFTSDPKKEWWTSPEITIGTGTATTQTLNLTVLDNALMESRKSITVNVDNVDPALAFTTPAENKLLDWNATILGSTSETTVYYAVSRIEGSGQTVNDVTPNSITDALLSSDKTDVLATKWMPVHADSSWSVICDGAESTDSETHTDIVAKYLTEDYLGITTHDAIDAEDEADRFTIVTPVYFWVKAIDDCGNETVAHRKYQIDPQSENPKVNITSPVDENGDHPKLGGTITLRGDTSDNKDDSQYIWIQIDSGTDGFKKSDLTEMKTNCTGQKFGNRKTNKEITDAEFNAITNDTAGDYGIMLQLNGRTNWSFQFNDNGKYDPTSGTRNLTITAYATDGDKKCSTAATQVIIIDSDTPYFVDSSLELKNYSTNAKQAYTGSNIVKGKWYLTGIVRDTGSGIKGFKYKKKQTDEYTQLISTTGTSYTDTADSNFWVKPITSNDAEYNSGIDATVKNYRFSIPLGSDVSESIGSDSVTIHITEDKQNLPLSSEKSFSLSYDNKAPEFDMADAELSEDVSNTSGFYKFTGKVSEESLSVGQTTIRQTGVKRVAFYFTRDLSYSLKSIDANTYKKHGTENTNDLFDVMLYHSNKEDGSKDEDNNPIDDVDSGNMIVNYKGKVTSGDLTYDSNEGLYWKKHSGSITSNTFTYTGSVDPNIHPKGLIKVNGVIYLIKDVSDLNVEIDSDVADAPSVDAYFAICNVIDNYGEKSTGRESTTKGYGYGYYPKRLKDDGDLITESFYADGTTWNFEAAINSKNLPDGPITIHFVAFDEAGNCSKWDSDTNGSDIKEGGLALTVKNNAPRIAGMTIGTDQDGNGEVDDEELINLYSNVYSNGYNTLGEETTDVEFPAGIKKFSDLKSVLTVKGKTVVKPELVGGNGKINYSYQVFEHGTGLNWNSTVEYSKDASSDTIIAEGITDEIATLTKPIELLVSDFIGTTNDEDKKQIKDGLFKKFKFSFGDSTPGTTLENGAPNAATLSVLMDVALREENKAKNWILPFYWNGKSDASTLYDSNGALGHIELSKDLPEGTFTSDNTDKEYDLDPKVSGKIKIEGIAQDDTLLRDIYVQFNKIMGNGNGSLGNANTVIASYDAENAEWTTTSPLGENNSIDTTKGWAASVQRATYGDLIQAGIISEEELPKDAEKTDRVKYATQEYGHVVHWILYVDTAILRDANGVIGADKDVIVTATATDRGTPKWSDTKNGPDFAANQAEVTNASVTQSGGTNGSSTLSGYYQMDVVPYITTIVTRLSQESESNPSIFNRSATGVYPIRRGEQNVKVYGFNLANKSQSVKLNNVSVGSVSVTAKPATTAEAKIIGDSYIAFNVSDSASTSGPIDVSINSLVTLNNENSKTAEYDLEPNNQNNMNLNDDRSVYVWGIENPVSTTTPIRYPSFRISKGSAQKYAFVYDYAGDEVRYYYEGKSTNKGTLLDTSFSQWYSTACHVDDNGNLFAGSQNGDSLGNGTYANYKFYSFASADNMTAGPYYDGTNGAYQPGGSSIRLENAKYNSIFYAERVKNPKIATYGSGTEKVYTVYYDSAKQATIFRDGTAKNNGTDVTYGGNIQDRTNSTSPTEIEKGAKVGEYCGIGVIPSVASGAGRVVVCWNSGNSLKLKVYNPNATSNKWSSELEVDSDFAGEYCDLAVDKAGGIHIAYYRAGNKLKYAYLESYSDTVPDICMVDSYLSVGENISIETSTKQISANGVSRYVPYISYYTAALKMAKVAWPVALGTNVHDDDSSTANTFINGTESDQFTGAWEVQVIPTDVDTKLLNYTIGVGEKKNDLKDADNNDIQSVMLGYSVKTGLQTALLY